MTWLAWTGIAVVGAVLSLTFAVAIGRFISKSG